MSIRRTTPVLFLATLVLASQGLAQSQTIGLEVRAGVGFGTETLGFSTGASTGHFNLGDISAAPLFGFGVLLPGVGPIRPHVRVSYMIPEGLTGNWIPCDPGTACPAIFLPIDAEANRFQATAGVEIPLLASSLPVQPYATLGAGLRRYGFSWQRIGDETDSFQLEAGSYGETDFVARFGLGATLNLGGFDLSLEGSADMSSFGPGLVPTPDQPAPLESTVDLGRDSQTEFSISAGLRKYLN